MNYWRGEGFFIRRRAVKLIARLGLVQIPARSTPTCEICLRDSRATNPTLAVSVTSPEHAVEELGKIEALVRAQ